MFSSVVTTPNSKIAAVDPISFLNYHRSNMYIIYSIYTYIYIDPFYLVLMYLLALESLVKYCIYLCWWLRKSTHSQHLWDDEPRSQCRLGRSLQMTELETTHKRSAPRSPRSRGQLCKAYPMAYQRYRSMEVAYT